MKVLLLKNDVDKLEQEKSDLKKLLDMDILEEDIKEILYNIVGTVEEYNDPSLSSSIMKYVHELTSTIESSKQGRSAKKDELLESLESSFNDEVTFVVDEASSLVQYILSMKGAKVSMVRDSNSQYYTPSFLYVGVDSEELEKDYVRAVELMMYVHDELIIKGSTPTDASYLLPFALQSAFTFSIKRGDLADLIYKLEEYSTNTELCELTVRLSKIAIEQLGIPVERNKKLEL